MCGGKGFLGDILGIGGGILGSLFLGPEIGALTGLGSIGSGAIGSAIGSFGGGLIGGESPLQALEQGGISAGTSAILGLTGISSGIQNALGFGGGSAAGGVGDLGSAGAADFGGAAASDLGVLSSSTAAGGLGAAGGGISPGIAGGIGGVAGGDVGPALAPSTGGFTDLGSAGGQDIGFTNAPTAATLAGPSIAPLAATSADVATAPGSMSLGELGALQGSTTGGALGAGPDVQTAGGSIGGGTPAGTGGSAVDSTFPWLDQSQLTLSSASGLGSDGSSLGSKILSGIGAHWPALLAGGALLPSLFMANQTVPGMSQLQAVTQQQAALAQSQQGEAATLLGYMNTGQVPGAAQAQLNQVSADAKAQIRSRFASAGMSGSTPEAQALGAVDSEVAAQKWQIIQSLTQAGLGALGQAGSTLSGEAGATQALMNAQIQQDQALQQAIARFASALAGGAIGGGTYQLTPTSG